MKLTCLWHKTVIYAYLCKVCLSEKPIFCNIVILYVKEQKWYFALAFPTLNLAHVEINVLEEKICTDVIFSKSGKLLMEIMHCFGLELPQSTGI